MWKICDVEKDYEDIDTKKTTTMNTVPPKI